MISAAVAYRQVGARATVLGATDSLENIVSSPLPDGAECWVIENSSVYRFDKASAQTADGVRVVAPIAGGGRWHQLPVTPLQITSASPSAGSISAANLSAGVRIVAVVMRNVPVGSSLLVYGTLSAQPPSVAGGSLEFSLNSSQNPGAPTLISRSEFFEDIATRRSWSAACFTAPFAQAQTWICVRLIFQSLAATAMTMNFPPDQASLTVMVLPPLTKV
jgi:hypothetical protein